MKNATELTLTTQSIVDDDTALEYVGPVTEVVIWRNSRTNRIEHAQPGDYIVKDRDGFPRRYSAADFADLFEAAPTPIGVTGASASVKATTGLTIVWTDNVAGDDVNVYLNGVFHSLVAAGVQTKALTGLTVDTAYAVVLKTVNSYGQESAAVTVNTYTIPLAPTSLVGTVIGKDAVNLVWVNASETAKIQPYKDGVAFGSPLAAGTTWVNVTGLTTLTAYAFTVKHIGDPSTFASAASNTQTKTTT